MAQPPDGRLTYMTQHQRVMEWLNSIDRPNGIHFLDMDAKSLLVLMNTLDRKTRSNLEKSCKILLSISRSDKPHLQQLCLHFTTTWNHDQFAEITAQFSPEHSFHSIFMSKKKSPNWITGGWSIDRQKNITSGIFQPEKLRLSATFVERTSRYIEYWLRNFQIDTLRIKVENLIPGKENSIQQSNYTGEIPPLKLKKLIIHGANNIRFINNWLDNLVPNAIDPLDDKKKIIDVEFLDVGKLDQIFHHSLMTTGKVNLTFNRVSTHFTRKTLNFVNSPMINIVARQVPSEAVNSFLKRWCRGEIIEDFQYLHLMETTQWPSQQMHMMDALSGLRYQIVDLKTDVKLRILEKQKEFPKPAQIFQITGPRPGFCAHFGNQFIFEIPKTEEIGRAHV